MYAKPIYITLLIINNLVGIFFLGFTVLASHLPNMAFAGFAAQRRLYAELFFYVVAVTVIFSLISLLIKYKFRDSVSLTNFSLPKAFLIQAVFFLFSFSMMWLAIVIRFKSLAN